MSINLPENGGTKARKRPALISFGIKDFKEAGLDMALILAAILIFAGIAFIIYYLRWA